MKRLALAAALCLSAGALLTSGAAFADDASKAAKIAELVRLQGLEPQIASVMARSRAEGERTATAMVAQMGQGFELPPEMTAKLQVIQTRFMKSLDPAFTPADVVRIWADNYTAQVSEPDVDAAIAYYGSPAGQREVAASKYAANEMSTFFQSRMAAQMKGATDRFITDLKDAMRDCTTCTRKADAPAQPVPPLPAGRQRNY